MTKLKLTRPPLELRHPDARHCMVPVRVSAAERARIAELARRYTDGNVSEYLRYAALNFKPTKKDLG